MESYNQFANVYDLFMEDTPYDRWFEFINDCFKRYELEPKVICELGCGTGQMTQKFAATGKAVIGIDLSAEMLMVAQNNAYEAELDILYSMQDMATFELGEAVDVICSCCDSVNYLTYEDEIDGMLQGVVDYLVPGGLFIFDLNTPYKYKNILGQQNFADQTEEAAYIWTNYYDEETKINEYEVSFFIQDESGKYERSIENHFQKAYDLEEMKRRLEKIGLEVLGIYDNYTFDLVKEESERATFVVRKPLE